MHHNFFGIRFQAFIIDLITDAVKREVTFEKQKFARNEEKENNNICWVKKNREKEMRVRKEIVEDGLSNSKWNAFTMCE